MLILPSKVSSYQKKKGDSYEDILESDQPLRS